MILFCLESIFTLPMLYAIVGTVVEFRFGKLWCRMIIGLAICITIVSDYWLYINTGYIYKYTWITTCIPSFLSLFYLAKYRDGSFYFAYLTECVLASIATLFSYIISYLLPWQHHLIQIFIHIVLLAATLIICRHLFYNKVFETERTQGKRWLLYCVMPVLCLVIWAMFSSSPARLTDIKNKVYIPYVGHIYPQYIPVFIVLMAVVVYMLFLIMVIIRGTHRAEIVRQERAILDFQSRALEERLSSFEKKDESLRILRHDTRHHLSILSGLLENKEYSQAQKYLGQVDHNLKQLKQQSYCSNAIINAILPLYVEKAQKEGIPFSVQINISENLSVDHFDIGAVISNALENAMNACMEQTPEEKRFIIFQFIQYKKQFVLDISNSFNGIVEFDINDKPVSQSENHGIGSQSINAFSQKYNATTDYSAQNGVFRIRIMFSESV